MKKKNKGFTLIELLAVIVVLAIVMAIAAGAVMNTIKNTRTKAFLSSYEIVYDAIKEKIKLNKMDYNERIACSSNPVDENNCYDLYGIDSENYELEIKEICDNYYITLKGKNEMEDIKIGSEKSGDLPANSNTSDNSIEIVLNDNLESIGINESDSRVMTTFDGTDGEKIKEYNKYLTLSKDDFVPDKYNDRFQKFIIEVNNSNIEVNKNIYDRTFTKSNNLFSPGFIMPTKLSELLNKYFGSNGWKSQSYLRIQILFSKIKDGQKIYEDLKQDDYINLCSNMMYETESARMSILMTVIEQDDKYYLKILTEDPYDISSSSTKFIIGSRKCYFKKVDWCTE